MDTTAPAGAATGPTFKLNTSGVQAQAQVRAGQFVVLAGSTARAEEVPSLANHTYAQLRANLRATGQLVEAGAGQLRFTADTPFASPSAAAVAVLGRTANGKLEWKREDQPEVTYGDWLAQAGSAGPTDHLPAGGMVTTWQPFFRELAARLLDYEDRQLELIQILRTAGIAINHDEGEPLTEMDPFTFFSLILKHTSNSSALNLFAKVGAALGIQADVPTDLNGVPWSNPMNAWFFAYRSKRQAGDVPTLWQLARQAVDGNLDAQTFEAALNIRKVALPKLTQGLFWLNPERYLALNGVNVPYLQGRGVAQAGQVQTLADYDTVLGLARRLNADFPALSHAAWLQAQSGNQVAVMDSDHFPFTQYQADAGQYVGDRVKGNLVLDRKYAPLLLDLMAGNWTALKPSRSPYSGREQLAVKVSLGGGAKTDSGAFARALLFADGGGYEYVTFPAGLTLEAGLPDGKADGPRQALQDPDTWAHLLALLNAPLPEGLQATLTLNTEFGALTLLPLGPAQWQDAETALERYRQGTGLNRRLRIGLSLHPQHLTSDAFPDLLDAALTYIDELLALLDRLMSPPTASPATGSAEPVIEVAGTQTLAHEPQAFQPVPGVPLNQILYGPPGTGKTYRVVEEALAVLDPVFLADHAGREGRAARKARYDGLVAQGRVSFITFHQSFGYEDFIEGIKPVMTGGVLSYRLDDGVFLKAVRAAGGHLDSPTSDEQPTPAVPQAQPGTQVWRMYIDGSVPVSRIRDLSLTRGELRMGSFKTKPRDLTHLGVEELSGRQLLFKDSMRTGDLVLLATGVDRIGAVGIVTGDYLFDPHSDPAFATDYAHARSVNWLATGLNLSATGTLGKPFAPPTLQRVTGVSPEQVLKALGLALPPEPLQRPGPSVQPHVLIIDEINRGNISKIFGELITLLESSKRAGASEALSVTLPLSRRTLSIPQSLYVIGTMNTADRSLTLLDAALRRRFVFKPVWPEPELLPVLTLEHTGLDLRKFLFVINDRIERLLSREQVIGHAYLLGLPATLEGVASAVRERILPLLEEYFFEDWSKIREVLGDPGKPLEAQFIHQIGKGSEIRYRLNPQAFGNIEAFTGVYAQVNDADFPFNA
ncbi:DUF4357 domain-containing protein [Deinococcus arcticus]|uniref:McrB n=1 Tax=Deinococcus arcticus TaxID=2136176 RepID=A0A2T3W554_9DEIO|nr:DUF4357 domain-containing protein [Deinococcus arcticus]PTA66924.1 McrB [Deinococcus arcticus]